MNLSHSPRGLGMKNNVDYDYALDALKEMYQGYDEHYWSLVYSLEPEQLIAFFQQVNTILTKQS